MIDVMVVINEIILMLGIFVAYMDANQGIFKKFEIKSKLLKNAVYIITIICGLLSFIFDFILC